VSDTGPMGLLLFNSSPDHQYQQVVGITNPTASSLSKLSFLESLRLWCVCNNHGVNMLVGPMNQGPEPKTYL